MSDEEYKILQATAFGIRKSDGRLYISRKTLREFLPPGFPTIVTLCGSTRFKKQYEDAAKELTLEGKLVFSVGYFGHIEDGDGKSLDQRGPVKVALDETHLRKIDASDEILVVCPLVPVCQACEKPCGIHSDADRYWSDCCNAWSEIQSYWGESTKREIQYAFDKGKRINHRTTP